MTTNFVIELVLGVILFGAIILFVGLACALWVAIWEPLDAWHRLGLLTAIVLAAWAVWPVFFPLVKEHL